MARITLTIGQANFIITISEGRCKEKNEVLARSLPQHAL